MKVRVLINAVQDRETGKTYTKGTTFDLPEERALPAIKKGYVEEAKNVRAGKVNASDNN
jgi:hypothetical protein